MFLKQVSEDVYFDPFRRKFVNEDEKKVFHDFSIHQLNELLKMRSENKIYLVFTCTTLCNLKCDYCFQNSCSRRNMELSISIEVFDILEKYFVENNIKEVNCTIFGGEPLLYTSGVLKILNFFEQMKNKLNIMVDYLLTTNGLIADPTFLLKIYKFGVKNIQVTFDGDEEINNLRRKSINNDINPYKTITFNLLTFVKIFDNIAIKYNFDKENIDRYDKFLLDLNKLLDNYKNKVHIILESIQKTPCNVYEYSYDNICLDLAKSYIKLIKLSIDNGYKYSSKIFNTPCMHINKNSFMIDTDGQFYSCISGYNIDEFKINISKKQENLDKREQLKKISILEKHCKKCEYLPTCFGGCAYEIYTDKKNIFRDINCRKKYFDYVVKSFYKEIYLKGLGDRIE